MAIRMGIAVTHMISYELPIRKHFMMKVLQQLIKHCSVMAVKIKEAMTIDQLVEHKVACLV
jgi:uncharacterized protein YjcR